MNDSYNSDNEMRFDKLYRLLGDDINSIFSDAPTDNVFNEETTINNSQIVEEPSNQNTVSNPVSTESPNQTNINNVANTVNTENTNTDFVDVFNIFDGNQVNNTNNNQENLTTIFSNTITSNDLAYDSNVGASPDNVVPAPVVENTNPQATPNINIPTPIEISNAINNSEVPNESVTNTIANRPYDTYRNTTIVEKKPFDDGLDSEIPKRSFLNFLASKKLLSVLLVLVFISVVGLAIKTFYLKNIVNVYNEYSSELDHETDNNTKVYEDSEINNEALRKVAADELIECIKAPIDIDSLPDNITSIIKNINNYYRSSSNYFAFLYKDIYTGFTVSYNENGKIFAASTIKAPVNIYIYEKAKAGEINLDEELTYTSKYYNNGTGVLKNKETNTNYTIRELSSYAIRNSDNAAHNMLMDKYGRNNIKEFWSKLGTTTIFTGNDNWGLISAHDAKIYMSELYNFYVDNAEYGNELMNNFIGATTKFITGKNNYIVANKSGWSGSSQHDVSIIFAENPYMLIGLTNMGNNQDYMTHFNFINDLAYQLHQEYWQYKKTTCDKIKQYN